MTIICKCTIKLADFPDDYMRAITISTVKSHEALKKIHCPNGVKMRLGKTSGNTD